MKSYLELPRFNLLPKYVLDLTLNPAFCGQPYAEYFTRSPSVTTTAIEQWQQQLTINSQDTLTCKQLQQGLSLVQTLQQVSQNPAIAATDWVLLASPTIALAPDWRCRLEFLLEQLASWQQLATKNSDVTHDALSDISAHPSTTAYSNANTIALLEHSMYAKLGVIALADTSQPQQGFIDLGLLRIACEQVLQQLSQQASTQQKVSIPVLLQQVQHHYLHLQQETTTKTTIEATLTDSLLSSLLTYAQPLAGELLEAPVHSFKQQLLTLVSIDQLGIIPAPLLLVQKQAIRTDIGDITEGLQEYSYHALFKLATTSPKQVIKQLVATVANTSGSNTEVETRASNKVITTSLVDTTDTYYLAQLTPQLGYSLEAAIVPLSEQPASEQQRLSATVPATIDYQQLWLQQQLLPDVNYARESVGLGYDYIATCQQVVLAPLPHVQARLGFDNRITVSDAASFTDPTLATTATELEAFYRQQYTMDFKVIVPVEGTHLLRPWEFTTQSQTCATSQQAYQALARAIAQALISTNGKKYQLQSKQLQYRLSIIEPFALSQTQLIHLYQQLGQQVATFQQAQDLDIPATTLFATYQDLIGSKQVTAKVKLGTSGTTATVTTPQVSDKQVTILATTLLQQLGVSNQQQGELPHTLANFQALQNYYAALKLARQGITYQLDSAHPATVQFANCYEQQVVPIGNKFLGMDVEYGSVHHLPLHSTYWYRLALQQLYDQLVVSQQPSWETDLKATTSVATTLAINTTEATLPASTATVATSVATTDQGYILVARAGYQFPTHWYQYLNRVLNYLAQYPTLGSELVEQPSLLVFSKDLRIVTSTSTSRASSADRASDTSTFSTVVLPHLTYLEAQYLATQVDYQSPRLLDNLTTLMHPVTLHQSYCLSELDFDHIEFFVVRTSLLEADPITGIVNLANWQQTLAQQLVTIIELPTSV